MEWNGLLHTAKYFNEDNFSDITIRFSGREIKAHKIILCHASEYFNGAIGPGSQFKEANETVLELKGDDPQAVEAMLRWIYSVEYIPNCCGRPDEPPSWKDHFNLVITTDKYAVKELEQTARIRLEERATRMTNTNDIIELIRRPPDYPDRSGRLKHIIAKRCYDNFMLLFQHEEFCEVMVQEEELRDKLYVHHFPKLMKTDKFRDMLKQDSALAIKHLDRFNDWTEKVEEKEVWKCKSCGHEMVLSK